MDGRSEIILRAGVCDGNGRRGQEKCSGYVRPYAYFLVTPDSGTSAERGGDHEAVNAIGFASVEQRISV
jgi:hypothetical protein